MDLYKIFNGSLFLFIGLCILSCFIFGVIHSITLIFLLLAIISGILTGIYYMMTNEK